MIEERYQRQMLVSAFGREGQEKLAAATVLVVGCGATGSNIAHWLVRAGVGRVRLADRDIVKLSNLPRQMLFDEEDVRFRLPKAVAAAHRLRELNSDVIVEPVVTNVQSSNILSLMEDVDLVMDGTDNFATRYLINDAALKLSKPWVYTGVLATYGMTATFVPGETACLRCLFGPLTEEEGPTCATVGVLGPTVGILAAIAAGEAIKLLSGFGKRNEQLLYFDLRDLSVEKLPIAPDPECPACHGHYDYLEAVVPALSTHVLCSGGGIQVKPETQEHLDLTRLAQQLGEAGQIWYNQDILQLQVGQVEMTLFPNGRAILHGITDEKAALQWYHRYVTSRAT